MFCLGEFCWALTEVQAGIPSLAWTSRKGPSAVGRQKVSSVLWWRAIVGQFLKPAFTLTRGVLATTGLHLVVPAITVLGSLRPWGVEMIAKRTSFVITRAKNWNQQKDESSTMERNKKVASYGTKLLGASVAREHCPDSVGRVPVEQLKPFISWERK